MFCFCVDKKGSNEKIKQKPIANHYGKTPEISTPSKIIESDKLKAQQKIIIPLIHRIFSNNPKSLICFSLDKAASTPLIIPAKNAPKNSLTVEKFIDLLAERWQEEIIYSKEITSLKNESLRLFDALCNNSPDQSFIDHVLIQKTLFTEKFSQVVEIFKTNIIQDFANALIAGFQNATHIDIHKTLHYILYQPLLTPYPVGLLELMKNKLKEIANSHKKISQLEHEMTTILLHMENYYKIVHLSSQECLNQEMLFNRINLILTEKKLCTMTMNTKDFQIKELQKNMKKCIKSIYLKCSISEFLENKIQFIYNGLEIIDLISPTQITSVAQLIPRNISQLILHFQNFKSADLAKFPRFFHNLSSITELSFDFDEKENNITDNAIQYIIADFPILHSLNTLVLDLTENQITDKGLEVLVKTLQNIRNLHNLQIDFSRNHITNNGIAHLSNMFSCTKTFRNLILNFSGGDNEITQKGIETFADSLDGMTNLRILQLYFSWGKNQVDDSAILTLTKTFKSIHHLTNLVLNFSGYLNQVTDLGVNTLASALKDMQELEELVLYFSENKITDNGVISLANALGDIKSVHSITLDFGNYMKASNRVTDYGIMALGRALKHCPHLKSLTLSFFKTYGDAYQISDDGVEVLANTLQDLRHLVYLIIDFSSNNVSDKGMEFLANSLSNLKSLTNLTLYMKQNKISEKGKSVFDHLRKENSKIDLTFTWQNGKNRGKK